MPLLEVSLPVPGGGLEPEAEDATTTTLTIVSVTVLEAGGKLLELIRVRAILGEMAELVTTMTTSQEGGTSEFNGRDVGSISVGMEKGEVGILERRVTPRGKLTMEEITGRKGAESSEEQDLIELLLPREV